MITNKEWISQYITNNRKETIGADGTVVTAYEPVPYRWTHGATDNHLGDGLLLYSIVQLMRYKTIICLGSGGGFVPRILTQARLDLYDQGIFEGDRDYNWGDIGVTYLVDAANGIGGVVDYLEEDSFFRSTFYPRYIKETTENAYYNFFVKQDIKADFIHIDAGHSYEDVKLDFDLYSKLLKPNGMISIHDTDRKFEDELIISEDAKKDYIPFEGPSRLLEEISSEWKQFNFFNTGQLPNKPSSTGITLLQRA
jgi:hypothetical protein|tara:strand:- start:1638 stop:2396 length:759 start_codon:yes stop_codon:yes gene_type:complete